jgi:molybdopterin-binding protein
VGDVTIRVGEAAEMLGVSVETVRRWERAGRLRTTRTTGGQRLVALAEVTRLRDGEPVSVIRARGALVIDGSAHDGEVTRLRDEQRRSAADRPIVAQSARNRFAGIVTRIERDGVAAVVELQAGPHRLVSLMTAEAVEELGLRLGDEAVAVVKATNVVVEVPSSREPRG